MGFDSVVVTLHDEPCLFVVVMQQYELETHVTAIRVPRSPSMFSPWPWGMKSGENLASLPNTSPMRRWAGRYA